MSLEDFLSQRDRQTARQREREREREREEREKRERKREREREREERRRFCVPDVMVRWFVLVVCVLVFLSARIRSADSLTPPWLNFDISFCFSFSLFLFFLLTKDFLRSGNPPPDAIKGLSDSLRELGHFHLPNFFTQDTISAFKDEIERSGMETVVQIATSLSLSHVPLFLSFLTPENLKYTKTTEILRTLHHLHIHET